MKLILHTGAYMLPRKSDIYETPDRVFDIILDHWDFKKASMFDPCPLNPKFNGLEIIWTRLNYVNPPYSKLSEFVDKALDEKQKFNNRSIMLLPSKTEQKWFHKLEPYWENTVWIRSRLQFKGTKFNSTLPHFLIMI